MREPESYFQKLYFNTSYHKNMAVDPFFSMSYITSSRSIPSHSYSPFTVIQRILPTHRVFKTILTNSLSLYSSHSANEGCAKGTISERVLWRRASLPLSMDRDNSAHNHWLLIAQTQNTGILQAAMSEKDTCNQNSKSYTPPFPMPSYYYHNFLTLPTQSKTSHTSE